MRIVVSGYPETNHRSVAKIIASRLNIPYFSIADIAKRVCLQENVDFSKFKEHENALLDGKINSLVMHDLELRDSFVLDSMCARFFLEDTYSILLTKDAVVSQNPISFISERRSEVKFLSTILGKNYDESDYSVIVNVANESKMNIADFIITNFQTGCDGSYVHKSLVLPMHPAQSYVPNDIQVDFSIGKYYSTYLLEDNCNEAVSTMIDKTFIRASKGIEFIADAEISSNESYEPWFKYSKASDSTLLALGLTRYCNARSLDDCDQALLDFLSESSIEALL